MASISIDKKETTSIYIAGVAKGETLEKSHVLSDDETELYRIGNVDIYIFKNERRGDNNG